MSSSSDPYDADEACIRGVFYDEVQEPKQVDGLVHGVRGSINDEPVFASTAPEIKVNVISESFAHQCKLEIQKSRNSFILGHGRKIESVGKTSAIWQFDRETMDKGRADFVVLSKCSRPVILGNDFLSQTQTLTTNWHRLRQQAIPAEDFSCVHIFGDSPHSIAGRIRKQPIYALPATGCEVNLVSEEYILSRGLGHKVDKRRKTWLKLIDGSLLQASGEIRMPWAFGDEK